jgi:hypothetical protein
MGPKSSEKIYKEKEAKENEKIGAPQNFGVDGPTLTGKVVRPNVPIHMGFHICD